MKKAFCGLIICYLLIGVIITHEQIIQENSKKILESKQRIIDYQIKEQQRLELMKLFENKISYALNLVNKKMKTTEALSIFCDLVQIKGCKELFDLDLYQNKAILKKEFELSGEGFSVVFPRGGFFYGKS